MPNTQPTNAEIASVLEQIADLLETQGANPFRVQAYREGARTVRAADEPLADVVRRGDREALRELPGIGEGLAGTITEYVKTGRSNQLQRLRGEVSPEDVFVQVPGIGDELAERIARELDINTLEELEQAAHESRLDEVEGFGPKRIENVRVSLAGMLSRAARRRARGGKEAEEREQPSVGTLLEVDAEYRRKAEAGELKRIAPRRFNPEDEAWLPIMHTEKAGWDFTALYSNTARAHELGKTHDWVVIYFDRGGEEDQATVVSATSGPLKGKRVVRGREPECRAYYEEQGE